jgi:S-(hydroxymethyl)glutathione dehydrogenase / alcohol dehydrogenase
MKKIKAAVLVEQNRPLEVADITLPEELFFGQVLVRVHYSGICGAQINEIEGAKGPDNFLPHLLGHEGGGVVEEVGPGVKTVKPGDHVVMHWRPSDGLQSDPPAYDWDGRRVNAGWVTTFNEMAVVSENRLTAIPADFEMKLAPLFGCAVTTAMGVINNDAQVKIGQSVVVFGVGGVGLNIVQAAAMVSANPIVGIDLHDSKLRMATKFGATSVINNSDRLDIRNSVLDVVGTGGADLVVDTTGNARVIETAYGLTHPKGKTVLVGVPRKGDDISIYSLPLHFDQQLTGSHGGDCIPHEDIPRYIRLYRAGRMKLDGLVTHEFGLEGINDAIALMREGNSARILISFSEG